MENFIYDEKIHSKARVPADKKWEVGVVASGKKIIYVSDPMKKSFGEDGERYDEDCSCCGKERDVDNSCGLCESCFNKRPQNIYQLIYSHKNQN